MTNISVGCRNWINTYLQETFAAYLQEAFATH